MTPLRLGAVTYLNARPLTWALDREPQRWQVRYDVPSVCADVLASGQIDLGLVPSIEYLQGEDYRFAPGVGIGSVGPVRSVALFTRVPLAEIRRIALDMSSRTSVALTKVLCRHYFRISPDFVTSPPDLPAMLREHDAGLLIGDPALETDGATEGLTTIDLGEAWTAMTGLPFVWAAWTGRVGTVREPEIALLQAAQNEGCAALDDIAREYGGHDQDKVTRAFRYLRDNIKYGLGASEVAGLQLFLDYAADLGLAGPRRRVEFF